MAFWLFKGEPGCYSYADLEREGSTIWDGISNALALQNLRKVRSGDRVFFYHTGREKAVVGEMEATRDPYADPGLEDSKRVVVELKPVRRFDRSVSLSRIKEDKELSTWDLVRMPRLSIVPVSSAQWARVQTLAGQLDA